MKESTQTKDDALMLSELFRKIVTESGYNRPDYWNYCMSIYLKDPLNKIPQHPVALLLAEEKLRSSLDSPRMSWKAFCQGLRFYGMKSTDIFITVYWENLSVGRHTLTIK